MQFTIAAVLALAGAAFANPAAITLTSYTTTVATITSCAPTVTLCPAQTVTSTITALVTYPVGAYPTGGALYPTGGAAYCAGGACGSSYKFPSPTGYTGPSYKGAGSQVKAAGALAGVGAVAALLL